MELNSPFKKRIFAVALLISVVSCQSDVNDKLSKNDYLLMSTLWVQKSAEYKALCYQTYYFAQKTLEERLKNYKGEKKPAIVLDLDETVLDNSPFEGWTIKTGEVYPSGWQEWCDLGEAELVPGAREFLDFAEQNRVEIFYISNRRESSRTGTIKNLQRRNLPNAEDKFVLLKTDKSTKEPRRTQVLKDHEILLLMGDNLLDFDTVFEGGDTGRRNHLVDSLRIQFGQRFIVLPNPMYGAWDKAVLDNIYKLSHPEQIKKRREALKGFDLQ